MSDYESDPESCIFCTISSGQDPNASILHSDDDVVCFWDIYPAAPQHYLVVPKKHIVNCAALDKHDVSLVKKMEKIGKDVLLSNNVKDFEDIRLGFHLPKFTSVGHLHLHVLAPASQICEYLKFKYVPNTEKFITVEQTIKYLQKGKPLNY